MFDELINELKEKYVGKDYTYGYGNWSEIAFKVAKELGDKYGINCTYDGDSKNKGIFIRYKGWTLFKVIIKKKIGDLYITPYGYRNRWHIKDIDIIRECNFNGTVAEQIEQINNWTDKQKIEKENDRQKALKILRMIMNEFNVDCYEARKLAKSIEYHWYNFTDEEIGRNGED